MTEQKPQLRWPAVAIVGYVLLSTVFWLAGKSLLAMALAQAVGGMLCLRHAAGAQSTPLTWRRVGAVGLGGMAVVLVATSIPRAYAALSPDLGAGLVYDGLVLLSPFFFWAMPKKLGSGIGQRVSMFDISMTLLMTGLVVWRAVSHWRTGLPLSGFWFIGIAIGGYLLINLSIKLLPGDSRAHAGINFLAAALLATWGAASQPFPDLALLMLGGIGGGIASRTITRGLSTAYMQFTDPALVIGLVYDGFITVGPLILQLLAGKPLLISDLLISAGCLAITLVRYQYHERQRRARLSIPTP